MADDTNSYYIMTDHLGTPFAYRNVATGEVFYTPHNPWGEPMQTLAGGEPPYRHEDEKPANNGAQAPDSVFAAVPLGLGGHLYDAGTGLVYMHNRYYHPRLGQFLTADFRAPDIYDPSTFTEPYSYASGNPVLYLDLNGLETWSSSFRDQREGESDDDYAVALIEFLRYETVARRNEAGITVLGARNSPNFDQKGYFFNGITTDKKLEYQLKINEYLLRHHSGKEVSEAPSGVGDQARWYLSLSDSQKEFVDLRSLTQSLTSHKGVLDEKNNRELWDRFKSLDWGSQQWTISVDGIHGNLHNTRGVITNLARYESGQDFLQLLYIGRSTKGPAFNPRPQQHRSVSSKTIKTNAFRHLKKTIPVPKELPKNIHDGQQGKHIIGHNNYLPGRSTLRKGVNPQEILDGIHSSEFKTIRLNTKINPSLILANQLKITKVNRHNTEYSILIKKKYILSLHIHYNIEAKSK